MLWSFRISCVKDRIVRGAACGLVSAWIAGSAFGFEASVTVPFPVRVADWSEATELFVTGPQQMLGIDGTGRTEFFLAPVPESTAVFVTVVFDYSESAPVSLEWRNSASGLPVVLSSDLAEGVAGWNQRTIQIPAELARNGGTLALGGDQRRVARLRFDWMEPQKTYVAVDQPVPTLLLGGRAIGEDALTGAPELTPPDAWFGDILEAALTDLPESLDGGILIEVPLDAPVRGAVLRAKLQGVPLNDVLDVWINGRWVGALVPVIPPLTDPGYLRLADGRVIYAGWREAALLLPDGALTAGDNAIELLPEATGWSVRDVALQLLAPAEAAEDPLRLDWPQLD